MAQKSFPRSLRSSKLLSQDFSFYSEKNYSSVWAKVFELSNVLFAFSQKNLLTKSKVKKNLGKRSGKKKVLQTFLEARPYTATEWLGTFRCSPILFKFSRHSLSKKYNPLKTAPKTRFLLKKAWKTPFNGRRYAPHAARNAALARAKHSISLIFGQVSFIWDRPCMTLGFY